MPEPGISVFQPPKAPVQNSAPAQVEHRSAPVRDARSVDGTVSSPVTSPAQARWQAMQSEITRSDPWSDPNVVITKDASGAITARPRTDGGTNGTPVPDAGGQPGQPQPPAGQPAVVGDKLVLADLELTVEQARQILAEKAARDSRAANRPADASGYSLDLPADFVMPPGLEWAWNETDPVAGPLIGQAKLFAHEHGMDQAGFSRMMGLFVSHQLTEQKRFNEAKAAELTKLGSNASVRVDAVGTFLEATCGTALGGAIRRGIFTADQLRGFEKIIERFTSQGISGNPGGARDGAGAGPERISDAAYSRMSYAEKQEYAARFDQRQFNG
jgi:hypothetical protein